MLARGWGVRLNLRGWVPGNLGCLPCSPPFRIPGPVCWGRGCWEPLLAAGCSYWSRVEGEAMDGQEQVWVEAEGRRDWVSCANVIGHLLGFPETDVEALAEGLVPRFCLAPPGTFWELFCSW